MTEIKPDVNETAKEPIDVAKLSYEEFRPILDAFAADVVNRLTALETNGVPGLRDFFATSALAILTSPNVVEKWDNDKIAHKAFLIADAMIKERDVKSTGN